MSEYARREKALAQYARAAQQVVTGIRQIEEAIQDMDGSDPLGLSDILASARAVLLDEETAVSGGKQRRPRSPGPSMPYEERAEQVFSLLPGTAISIAERIGDGISAAGVRQVIAKMKQDSRYARRLIRDVVKVDGRDQAYWISRDDVHVDRSLMAG